MKDCVFCKIINGEAPSYKIYEDQHVLAFLDIAKLVDGHTLVVPKKHYKSLVDTPEEVCTHVMQAVQKITKHYITEKGSDGVNVLQCNGKAAGQCVFHLHFHILPRSENDGLVLPEDSRAIFPLDKMQEKLKF